MDPTKIKFHRHALKQLFALAKTLKVPERQYDLRSNKGGPAVMGEITLHTDTLYIQVSDKDILIRSCTSHKDYTGGPNGFLPLSMLDSIPTLAAHVRSRRAASTPYELKNRGVPA